MIGVSIVIPTFNRPQLLLKLLESIKKQSFRNFEVIIVDDCSDDQESYNKVYNLFKNNFDIHYTTNPKRKGAPHSRNRGILQAKFDLVALVDDDDEWESEKLKSQVEVFSTSSESLGIVYTWTQVVDSNKQLLYELRPEYQGKLKNEILSGCFIPSPSVMVRKKALIDSGLFDEQLPSCQDWDMWTRIIFNGYECRVCKSFLTFYYKHDGPSIGTSPKARLGFKIFYKKHLFKFIRYRKLRHLVRLLKLSVGL